MTYSAFHCHSYFSVLDAFSSPKEMLDRARELKLKGFQCSEHGNMYSFVYYDKIKKDYPEIKMIFGMEAYECNDMSVKDPNDKYYHLLLTCINEKSRIALNEIVTKSNFEGFYYRPRVDLNLLRPYGDLFIVSSACLASKLSREKDYQKCIEYIEEYKSIFPHFYLEIMSHRHVDQVEYNQKLLQLSKDTNTDFIITCDSHVANESDLYYQGKLVQIARDDDTVSEVYADCYLQDEDTIHEILDPQIGYESVRIGLENTNKITDMVENVSMPFQSPKLPNYPLPDGFSSNKEYLEYLVTSNWEHVFADFKFTKKELDIRRERVKYELAMINQMGFNGYFLIVWDFINWAKNNGVMVGSGRGSSAGSIVCYLLGITNLDPIKYDLVFERFLNPERVSMPDIDLDFNDRDRIVQYLTEKYGEDKVCQLINYAYITPLLAIKDSARILGIPYYVSEQISGRFIQETFEECMSVNESFIQDHLEYKELFDVAAKISGRLRQVSIHAGGVGIVDTKISDYMGMKLGAKNERVIQVDKVESENIGIIKFDILGVSTLSVIKEILEDTKINEWDINPNNDALLHDKQTFELLSSANTDGVFQVESQGMKDLLLRLKPDRIEDVSSVLALYRPDSMEFLEDYIFYKHNPDQIKLWHKDMLPVVKKTYGTIVYQEQLMNLVRIFSGRSMGGADKFRKAIGKKDKELIKVESSKLYQEIINNGYDAELALKISEYLSTKGGYMFNLSHSMSYSVITLQTAYLKAHYPVYFFKALFNQNKDDYGKLNRYILDSKKYDVKILPPNVNHSENNFAVRDNKILFGLLAIKGIGSKLVEQIIEERNISKFTSFDDFVSRVKPSIQQVVALIKSGAIPCKDKKIQMKKYALSLHEKREYKEVSTLPTEKVLKEKYQFEFPVNFPKQQKLEKYNFFKKKLFEKEQDEKQKKLLSEFSQKYMEDENLWEFETLSVFLENNPFEKIYELITPVDEIKANEKCVVVGVISDITKKKDRHGKQFAFINIYSSYDLLDVTVWHEKYKDYESLIIRGKQVAILCKKTDDNRLVCEKMKSYNKWLNDVKSNKISKENLNNSI